MVILCGNHKTSCSAETSFSSKTSAPHHPPYDHHYPACISPAGCVDGLLVRRRDGETHRGDHGLIPRGTDHLPLGPLRVVFQHTLLASVYRDLRGGQRYRMDARTRRNREGMEVMERQMLGIGTDGENKMEK